MANDGPNDERDDAEIANEHQQEQDLHNERRRNEALLVARQREMTEEELMKKRMDEINARMQLLSDAIPPPKEKVGGLLGQAVHLGQYQWEGLAGAMMIEMLYFILSLLFSVTFMQDTYIYSKMPDSLKLDLDNYNPDETPIYGFTIGRDGKVKMDFSRVLQRGEITPTIMMANGYLPKPDAALALRKRWGEYCNTMLGVSCDPELDAIYKTIREQGGNFYAEPGSPGHDPHMADELVQAGLLPGMNRPNPGGA